MNNIVVIKLGGIGTEKIDESFINQLKDWQNNGKKIVIVHCGGQVINNYLKASGHHTRKINGIRVTAKNDLPIIYNVLVNKVGYQLINRLKLSHLKTNQLKDNMKDLVTADFLNKELYGFVGNIKQIKVNLLQDILDSKQIPVIVSLGANNEGCWLNINADYLATSIAKAFNADQLILMTDVEGVLENRKLLKSLSIQQAQEKIKNNIITDGMIPKLESAVETIQG
ncbi:acetylglutamate kinase [Staphylococcus saccharolyticus]|uniref:acetylglutamate kinase n=1 Tax=Staphylococcus saccharolyticus TaxID=33028 RepID=UPI001EE3C858|nr:acetylglutamate kinase [Staphylococcus saccharolyticus]